jgi:formaldehyde-activating enzyme involved in methanogenesis
MTWQQRHDELVCHARRLVDQGIVRPQLAIINVILGTVRNASTDQLLHYESGHMPVAFHLRPQPWGEA